MKKLLLIAAVACASLSASAQYYEIANQIPNLISPALSGSLRYKGFAEASYLKGVGNQNADFLEFSTTQGFRYSDWFFMGAGIGVNVMFAHSDGFNPGNYPWNQDKNLTSTGVMIPLYTDFRFNFGNTKNVSFFADVRLGCSFLVSDSYIQISNGYLSSSENFYLRPSVGVRIPVNSQNAKQAVNVGVTYQLITSNYWYNYSSNVCLNSLGVNLSYEW